MPTFALRNLLPNYLCSLLWWNREKWGLTINVYDTCWQKWQQIYSEFYGSTQREGNGTQVNDAGYSVISQIDLMGKCVPEYCGLGSIGRALSVGEIRQASCLHKVTATIDKGEVCDRAPYLLNLRESYCYNENLAYESGKHLSQRTVTVS